MHSLRRIIAAATFVVATVAQRQKPDYANAVRVRVEGSAGTTAEGFVFNPQTGGNITTASGGTHLCDGTNDGYNPTPGPTCTSVMSQLVTPRNITFDGSFSSQFDDFFITRIGPDDSNTSINKFWGVFKSFAFTPAGGCEEEAPAGSSVLWYFDAFNKNHFLRLRASSPGATAIAGQPFTLAVTATDGDSEDLSTYQGASVMSFDPQTGMPIAGGVNVLSDATGNVTITEANPGVYFYKAYDDAHEAGRSNRIMVRVKKATKGSST